MSGVNVRAFPLTPSEGFVLSRIDGLATTQDLADLTGLTRDEVEKTVEKLVELGVAYWADAAVSLPRASPRAPTVPAMAPPTRPASVWPPGAARPNIVESKPPSTSREPLDPAGSHPPAQTMSGARVSIRRNTPRAQPAIDQFTKTDRPPPARESQPARDQQPPPRVGSKPPTDPAPAAPPSRSGGSKPPTDPAPRSGPAPEAAASAPAAADAPPASDRSPSASGSDEIELPLERRQRIDELIPKLDVLDHYQVLQITQEADTKAVRAAYFELSKTFHPDTAFRKNLGPYKARMETIFKRLTEAYEVLGKKKSRAEYDAYLQSIGVTRAAEALTSVSAIATGATPPHRDSLLPPPPSSAPAAAPEASASSTTAQSTSAQRSSPPPSAPAPPREMSEAAKQNARELAAKRLAGVRGISSSSPSPPTSSTPPAEPAPRDPKDVARSLASSIKSAASLTGGLDQAQRHAIEARNLEQRGDLAGAVREAARAVAVGGERPDHAQLLSRLSKQLSAQLREQYRQQALYEERHQKWALAAISWSRLLEGSPDDAEAAWRGASALIEANGDVRQAQRLAQRAVDLNPESAVAHRTLGRVYATAGLGLNARRELEKAAQLDPSDQMVKTLLGALKA